MLGIVFWVLGFVFWVLGFVFGVSGFVFWVLGLVFWVLGFVFWVCTDGIPNKSNLEHSLVPAVVTKEGPESESQGKWEAMCGHGEGIPFAEKMMCRP